MTLEQDATVETKWCCGCQDWQPVTDFGNDRCTKDGKQSSCRIIVRERWRAANEVIRLRRL